MSRSRWLASVVVVVGCGGPEHPIGNPPPPRESCPVPLTAAVTGTVLDAAGRVVMGAKVTVRLVNAIEVTATDDKGAFRVDNLHIGVWTTTGNVLEKTAAEIVVDVQGMHVHTSTIETLAEGLNTLPTITLLPDLPPGQLRGRVHVDREMISRATISIRPGNQRAETDANGVFAVDLAPGIYQAEVQAEGRKARTLEVVIEPNGVTLKDIDLR